MGKKRKHEFERGDIFISRNRTPIEEIGDIFYKLGYYEFDDGDEDFCMYYLKVMSNNPKALQEAINNYKRKLYESFEEKFKICTGDWLLKRVHTSFVVDFIDEIFVSEDDLKNLFVKIPKDKLSDKNDAFNKILDKKITVIDKKGDKK